MKNHFQRLAGSVTNVGTDWVEVTHDKLPRRFIIRRARAQVVGSGTQVALRLAERGAVDRQDIHIPIQYELSDSPLDDGLYDISLLFSSYERSPHQNSRGKGYIAVKSNQGTDNTVYYSFDLEILEN